MSSPISHCAKPSEKVGCFDRDDGAQGWTVVLDLVCCVPRHLIVRHEIETALIETKRPICPVSVFRQPKKPLFTCAQTILGYRVTFVLIKHTNLLLLLALTSSTLSLRYTVHTCDYREAPGENMRKEAVCRARRERRRAR